MKPLILALLCLPALASDRSYYVNRKIGHAAVGIGIAWAGHELGYPKTGIAVAFGVGIAKELYDRKHGGKFRAGDVAWTAAPGAVISFSFKW